MVNFYFEKHQSWTDLYNHAVSIGDYIVVDPCLRMKNKTVPITKFDEIIIDPILTTSEFISLETRALCSHVPKLI